MRQGCRFGTVLLSILSHLSIIIQCVIYDEPAPDPVIASVAELSVFAPSRNITCLGPQTDIPWNLRNEHYDGRSMQLLCADQLYGGSDTKPNCRAFCQDGDVFFGPTNMLYESEGWTRLERSLLECRNRCFCNDGLENPQRQPKEVATTRRTYRDPNSGGGIAIAVDRQSFPQGRNIQTLTRTYHFNPPQVLNIIFHKPVGILVVNNIRCGGPLPSFPLPDPFNIHDFASNQELCAVQLNGGNPAANAGAYCHRIGDLNRVVSFADDMTPRLDWTWGGAGGEEFFLAAAVRFHCWKNCLCLRPDTTPIYFDPLMHMWEYLLEKLPPGGSIPTGTGNKYPLGSSTDSKGKPRTKFQGGNNPPSAVCAATENGDSSCSLPWPVDILGPVPKVVASLGLPQPPPTVVGSSQNRACNNACSSNNDCGANCVCRQPSVMEAHELGVDLVTPLSAMCLDIASLFGRSLESQGQIECLCNATYIAPACCHSRDVVI